MPEPIHCPDCKRYIGEDIFIDGLHLLQIGGVPIWDTKMACPECGRVMYWSVRDSAIQAALRKMKEESKATQSTSARIAPTRPGAPMPGDDNTD